MSGGNSNTREGSEGERKMKPGKPVNVESSAPDAENPQAWDNMGRPTHRKSEVRLGREVQARIGQQLRALYDEVVKEGVPQHIADLVSRLSEQDDPAA
jgi:Anti-sigma factor NepR